MGAYALRRVLLVVPTLFGVSLAAFLLSHLAPGDPARQLLERQSQGVRPTGAEIAAVRHELGLDRPLAGQYLTWARGAVTGDLGISYGSLRPVRQELLASLPATLELTLAAAVLVLSIGVPVGALAAARHKRPSDHALRVVSLAGASMPSFWLALLLILLFSVHLSLLPAGGRGGLSSVVLPAVALALGPAAVLTRFTRASVLETLGDDHVRTARAKGLRQIAVVAHHALRNSLIPIVTAFGNTLGHLVAGAVVVETIFVWPGIGRLAIDAILERDYPLIQGVVLYAGAAFVVINLLVDLSYAVIDPRVRVGAGSPGRR